jgi:Catalytic LigB subunit of aromatic ring-opening dioxygenase
MAEILGLGTTHAPPLMWPGDLLRPKRLMDDPLQPERLRDPSRWGPEMAAQWAGDEGATYAAAHRAELVENMRWIRSELDAFAPELVVILGDDQYENFREDCVPAFLVCAQAEFRAQPFADGRANSWEEPPSKEFRFSGNQPAGKRLATDLIDHGFDVAYAYEPLRPGVPHAFLNTILFLDWDRRGFEYPILPFATNCYGRILIQLHGRGVDDLRQVPTPDQLAPPGPPPWRCFDLGRQMARTLSALPERIALIASASWSHAFNSPSTSYFHPSVEADREYLRALREADYSFWREKTTADLEAHGQQELLNWHILLGAMSELGRRPNEVRFLESWITNADKTFAVFPP